DLNLLLAQGGKVPGQLEELVINAVLADVILAGQVAVAGHADDVTPVVLLLVFQELKRVAATVGDVDQRVPLLRPKIVARFAPGPVTVGSGDQGDRACFAATHPWARRVACAGSARPGPARGGPR